MTHLHLVRLGEFGAVGRFRSADGLLYARGRRVVCRTARGLECGEVLGSAAQRLSEPLEADGQVLRLMSVEDELLAERLARRQDEAFEACQRQLREAGVQAVLMDVEMLFDGSACYFYFLGDPPPEAAALTEELARTYEATAQLEKFRETLIQGCGPDCGTEAAAGCGDGGCAGCAISSACRTASGG